MKPSSEPDTSFLTSERKKFLETLDTESDRGCVLIAAAHLDECIEWLLRARFLKERKLTDLLFTGLGPLTSFSAKIQVARALDLIDSWLYEDLEKIRKLRNKFAHQYIAVSFDHPEIVEVVM